MSRIKLFCVFLAGFSCIGLAQASVTIEGPTEVCPFQTYTFNIRSSFIFGGCQNPVWSIWRDGVSIAEGSGYIIEYEFPNPDNVVYEIKAFASGGIGCLTSSSDSHWVTTVYPTPAVSGPNTLCSGSSATLTATVNADFSCFHHKIRWTIPSGWSASATIGSQVTVTAPSSLIPTTGRIIAQVWYDDRNEFGPAGFIDILTGPPPQLNPAINGPQSLRKNARGSWTVGLPGSNTNCFPPNAYDYKWQYNTPSSGWTTSSTTGPTFTRNMGSDQYLQLRVDVTLRGPYGVPGLQETAWANVTCSNCSGGGGPIPIPDLPIMLPGDDPGETLVGLENPTAQAETDRAPSHFDNVTAGNLELNDIWMYPNPARDRLTLKLPVSISWVQINIYSTSGQLLYEAVGTEPLENIDLAAFNKGMYIMNVSTASRQFRKTFIVE